MVRIAIFAVLASGLAAFGQEQPNLFKSAPPEIDAALRQRVNDFYTLLKEGRFRQTDAFMAEDARDIYYEQEKKRIRGHEIVRINWDDSMKKAVVVTVIQTEVVMRGTLVEVGAPISSRWRIENGQWMVYFDTVAGKESPFGPMKAGPNVKSPSLNPEEVIKNPNLIFNQIKVEKDRVSLKSYEKSTDSILVGNGMPGAINVYFVPELTIPGFTHKVLASDLGAGEETKIVFSYDPGTDKSAKPTIRGMIRVDPFNKAYPVVIQFAIPEEVQKTLPKN